MNNPTQVFVPRRLYDMFKFQNIEFSRILDIDQLSIELGVETVAKLINANNLYNNSTNVFLFPVTNIGLNPEILLKTESEKTELVNKLNRRLEGLVLANETLNEYIPEVKSGQITVPLLFRIKPDVIGITTDVIGVDYEVVSKDQLKQNLLLNLMKQLTDLGVCQKAVFKLDIFKEFITVTGK